MVYKQEWNTMNLVDIASYLEMIDYIEKAETYWTVGGAKPHWTDSEERSKMGERLEKRMRGFLKNGGMDEKLKAVINDFYESKDNKNLWGLLGELKRGLIMEFEGEIEKFCRTLFKDLEEYARVVCGSPNEESEDLKCKLFESRSRFRTMTEVEEEYRKNPSLDYGKIMEDKVCRFCPYPVIREIERDEGIDIISVTCPYPTKSNLLGIISSANEKFQQVDLEGPAFVFREKKEIIDEFTCEVTNIKVVLEEDGMLMGNNPEYLTKLLKYFDPWRRLKEEEDGQEFPFVDGDDNKTGIFISYRVINRKRRGIFNRCRNRNYMGQEDPLEQNRVEVYSEEDVPISKLQKEIEARYEQLLG